MLELLEGKLSRAVLRGLGGSNPTRLPGGRMGNHRLYPAADCEQRPLVPRSRFPQQLRPGVRLPMFVVKE